MTTRNIPPKKHSCINNNSLRFFLRALIFFWFNITCRGRFLDRTAGDILPTRSMRVPRSGSTKIARGYRMTAKVGWWKGAMGVTTQVPLSSQKISKCDGVDKLYFPSMPFQVSKCCAIPVGWAVEVFHIRVRLYAAQCAW